jgi:hypothetical protein
MDPDYSGPWGEPRRRSWVSSRLFERLVWVGALALCGLAWGLLLLAFHRMFFPHG